MHIAIRVAAAAFILTGCTQIPPRNFSVPDLGLSQHQLDAEIRSITVTFSQPDDQVGAIDAFDVTGGGAITAAWHTALQEALDRTLVFRDEGTTKVSISVKIRKLDARDWRTGFKMITEAVARYEIVDRATGDIIFVRDIASSGTAPVSLGAARLQESINRAVQNNIVQFLQETETIDLGRPMFPAGSTS